jgi:hypothetical protein
VTSTDWILVANFAAVAVAAAAIWFSIRSLRNQIQVSTFLEYTKRYNKVMARLPYEARKPTGHFRVEELSSSQQQEFFSTYRDYLNICWEETWLSQNDRIDKETWKLWKESIRQTMDFPGFDDAWQELRSEYEPYGEFASFIEDQRTEALRVSPLRPGRTQ